MQNVDPTKVKRALNWLQSGADPRYLPELTSRVGEEGVLQALKEESEFIQMQMREGEKEENDLNLMIQLLHLKSKSLTAIRRGEFQQRITMTDTIIQSAIQHLAGFDVTAAGEFERDLKRQTKSCSMASHKREAGEKVIKELIAACATIQAQNEQLESKIVEIREGDTKEMEDDGFESARLVALGQKEKEVRDALEALEAKKKQTDDNLEVQSGKKPELESLKENLADAKALGLQLRQERDRLNGESTRIREDLRSAESVADKDKDALTSLKESRRELESALAAAQDEVKALDGVLAQSSSEASASLNDVGRSWEAAMETLAIQWAEDRSALKESIKKAKKGASDFMSSCQALEGKLQTIKKETTDLRTAAQRQSDVIIEEFRKAMSTLATKFERSSDISAETALAISREKADQIRLTALIAELQEQQAQVATAKKKIVQH